MHKNEGYLGNINVKRAGVESEWSEEQILEYKKCMESPVHFIENYVKIISLDEGLVPFKLYEYQENLIDHFDENRFSVILACRQSGKSITALSIESEPWTEFLSIEIPYNFLIVFSSASLGLVAPISFLLAKTAFFPSKINTTIGPEDRYAHKSL